jgi:threonine dehydrogenase-like Zn-dependent dehydrogenase
MEAEHGWAESARNVLTAQVGTIKTLKTAMRAVRRGGAVCAIGVYGTDVSDFPLGQLFDKGLNLKAGQAQPHVYIDKLMVLAAQGKLTAEDIVTHRMPLSEAPKAYRLFANKEEGCVKVVLQP